MYEQTQLFVMGGQNSQFQDLKSSEFLVIKNSQIQSTEGPELPFTVRAHCAIEISANTVFIIGGFQNGVKSKETWILEDPKQLQINVKQGPTLRNVKAYHTCGMVKIDNLRSVLVVAGGEKSQFESTNTVELLDLSNSSNGWKFGKFISILFFFKSVPFHLFIGPRLPYSIERSSMVTRPDGKAVTLIGGWNRGKNQFYTKFLELNANFYNWTVLNQSLSTGRRLHLSIPIPDNLISCN